MHEQLNEGIEAEKKSDLDHAERCYKGVLTAHAPAEVLAEAHCRLANLYRTRCQWDEALRHARDSARIANRLNDKKQYAEALNAEAIIHQSRGEFDQATPLLERVLTLTDDARMRGIALQNLGSIAALSGDLGSAERYFAESYGCFMRCGNTRGEAHSLNNYGRAALDRGNIQLAEDVLHKAVEIARAAEDAEMIALSTLNYAEAVSRKGDLARAEDLASTALGYFSHTGNRWHQIECLRLLGDIHVRDHNPATARTCYQQGLDLAKKIGARVEVSALSAALASLDKG
jgi:tetratricopeptide (TPR) repeat protein